MTDRALFFISIVGLLIWTPVSAIDKKASSRPFAWELKRHYGQTRIYTSPNNVRLTVRYRTRSPIKKMNFSNQLVGKLQQNKKRMLASIGIKNWKMHNSQVRKQKNGQNFIYLSGSYLDLSGQQIQFVEYHFYRDSRYLQILLTHPQKKTLLKDAKLAKIRDFRVRYGF